MITHVRSALDIPSQEGKQLQGAPVLARHFGIGKIRLRDGFPVCTVTGFAILSIGSRGGCLRGKDFLPAGPVHSLDRS